MSDLGWFDPFPGNLAIVREWAAREREQAEAIRRAHAEAREAPSGVGEAEGASPTGRRRSGRSERSLRAFRRLSQDEKTIRLYGSVEAFRDALAEARIYA